MYVTKFPIYKINPIIEYKYSTKTKYKQTILIKSIYLK